MARSVSEGDLASWLIKCDPRVNPELLRPAGAGGARLTSRCVVRGYRASMMRPGDPVLLWVSGDGRVRARGIWGVGRLTGEVDDTGAQPFVPLDLPVLGAPLTDAELRAAGIDDLEVQRMPAGSNPSWVSRQQWERLGPLLDALDG